MKEAYIDVNLRGASLKLVSTINTIVEDYQKMGYRLTVRQLYYQLVARDVIPNTERSYKNIVALVNNARLGGYIDWDAIEDRTRSFIARGHWDSGRDILYSAVHSFYMDRWVGQENRVFCIVEKEALAGVMERACREWDVPILAARGYPSASVLREFVVREFDTDGQDVIVLHLGDHDPSGIDMTRDLEDRLNLLSRDATHFSLERIALTMDQIQELNPPPNPAKTTDSRFASYRQQFGVESWELDALPPPYINGLVERHIRQYIDETVWDARYAEMERIRTRLKQTAEEFVD